MMLYLIVLAIMVALCVIVPNIFGASRDHDADVLVMIEREQARRHERWGK